MGDAAGYWMDRAEKAEIALDQARKDALPHRDRCFRVFDRELRMWVHIPWCNGAAVNGPDQCTCTFPESDIERATRELEAAKAEMHDLRQRYALKFQRLENRARWLERSLSELRDRPAPARPEDA